jgi:DNA-binding response OmpR family regulator
MQAQSPASSVATAEVISGTTQEPSAAPLKAGSSGIKLLIAVVEDNHALVNVLVRQLENSGMRTQVFHRAGSALKFLRHNFVNLVLLDISLPDRSGLGLLKDLKEEDIEVPVIFLTGSCDEPNKVLALNMGGDDYVTKPFSYTELHARIQAVLRRTASAQDLRLTKNTRVSDGPFDFCGAKVTPDRLEIAFPCGTIKKIGRKELGMLAYMHAQPNKVIPRRVLLHSVWGEHADVKSRSIDQYVVRIRNLFEAQGLDTGAFRTIHGVGYIYEPAV